MDDLNYIIGIGFSGADVARAIILAFFIAMISVHKRSIWTLGLWALAIDRLVWPMIEMGVAGHEPRAILGAYAALIQTFVDDIGLYVVRYIGLSLMIGGFGWMRTRIHGLASRPQHA